MHEVAWYGSWYKATKLPKGCKLNKIPGICGNLLKLVERHKVANWLEVEPRCGNSGQLVKCHKAAHENVHGQLGKMY